MVIRTEQITVPSRSFMTGIHADILQNRIALELSGCLTGEEAVDKTFMQGAFSRHAAGFAGRPTPYDEKAAERFLVRKKTDIERSGELLMISKNMLKDEL